MFDDGWGLIIYLLSGLGEVKIHLQKVAQTIQNSQERGLADPQ